MITADLAVAIICSVISEIIGGAIGYIAGRDSMEWQHELDFITIEELKEEVRKDDEHKTAPAED